MTNKAGLMTYRDNIEKLRNRVTVLIRQGKTQADIAKVMESEYGWAPKRSESFRRKPASRFSGIAPR